MYTKYYYTYLCKSTFENIIKSLKITQNIIKSHIKI